MQPIEEPEYFPTPEHLDDMQRDHDVRNGRPPRPERAPRSPHDFLRQLSEIVNTPTPKKLT